MSFLCRLFAAYASRDLALPLTLISHFMFSQPASSFRTLWAHPRTGLLAWEVRGCGPSLQKLPTWGVNKVTEPPRK